MDTTPMTQIANRQQAQAAGPAYTPPAQNNGVDFGRAIGTVAQGAADIATGNLSGLGVLLDPQTDSFDRYQALFAEQQRVQTESLMFSTQSNVSKAEYDARNRVVQNLK